MCALPVVSACLCICLCAACLCTTCGECLCVQPTRSCGHFYHVYVPVEVVVGRCDQQAAGALVSIGEGGGETDWCLLQSTPSQHPPAAWTFLWYGETEDLLLTVSQSNHRVLHLILFLLRFNSSSSTPVFSPLLQFLFLSSCFCDFSASLLL